MKSASIVINTYNRGNVLRDAIDSLRQQTFKKFELVIVNGPSSDNTEDVISKYAPDAIYAECKSRNLSESRNIGIGSSSGEVVAFLDDDAVAHPDWLTQIVSSYSSEKIGGVGGFTWDHTGRQFQSTFTVSNRLGDSFCVRQSSSSDMIRDNTQYYPTLLGANSSFSRHYLKLVGGFDETFEYFLDETDLCLRIKEAGGEIVTNPHALILHKYAPSDQRDERRIPRSYYASVKSKTYYCYVHNKLRSKHEIDEHLANFRSNLEFSLRWHVDRALLSAKDFFRLNEEIRRGTTDGYNLAMSQLRQNSHAARDAVRLSRTEGECTKGDESRLFRSNSTDGSRKLKIAFVSQGYPPDDTNGIARWTEAMALSLAANGHQVHVVTKSSSQAESSDYANGVWVHRYNTNRAYARIDLDIDTPESVLQRAAIVREEVIRLKEYFGVDVVSAPIWDVEGIGCTGIPGVFLITSLHTTYSLMKEYKADWRLSPRYMQNHVDRVIEAERWILSNSDMILANSRSIVDEVENSYKTTYQKNLSIVPHGLPDIEAQASANLGYFEQPREILFVGRLEKRKGLDTFLKSLVQMPNRHPMVINLVGASVDNDSAYSKDVGDLIEKVKSMPNLTLNIFGHITDHTLSEMYRRAYAVVVPSRYESFGLVAIEAMKYGTAVVAARVGGLAEIFKDEVEGLYFDPDDHNSLALKLDLLLRSSEFRNSIATSGRRRFCEDYTSLEMAEQFAAVVLERTCSNGK